MMKKVKCEFCDGTGVIKIECSKYGDFYNEECDECGGDGYYEVNDKKESKD